MHKHIAAGSHHNCVVADNGIGASDRPGRRQGTRDAGGLSHVAQDARRTRATCRRRPVAGLLDRQRPSHTAGLASCDGSVRGDRTAGLRSAPAQTPASCPPCGALGDRRPALAGRLLLHDHDDAAVEPAALAAQRRVAAGASRQLARGRGRALLLQLAGARSGRAAAEDPAHGRRRHASAPARGASSAARRTRRRRSRPVFAQPAARRRRLAGHRAYRARPPAGARDDVPDRARLSADRRVRRLVRPHAHVASPGTRAGTSRRTPPCAGRCRSPRPALAPATRRSTAASSTRRQQRIVDRRRHVRAAEGRPRDAGRLPRRAGGRPHLARRAGRRAAGRLRPPEPAADHRPRAPEPGAERQLAVGLHARQRGPRVAHRRRDRPARQPDLRGRGLSRRSSTLAKILQRAGRGSGDAARHQPGVADADHLHATTAASTRCGWCPTTSSRRPATSSRTTATSSPYTGGSRAPSPCRSDDPAQEVVLASPSQ